MKHFFQILLVFSLMASCREEESPPIDIGSQYFPLKAGIFQVYLVNETQYSAIAPPQVSVYELMTEVVDSFPNVQGGYSYVMLRSRRSADTEPWEILDTWSARKDNREIIVAEGNTPFVKAIFPVRSGTRWDGNALNSLGADEYELMAVDESKEVNGLTFAKTLTVEQERNEDLIVFNDERLEVYAMGVGLVYKEWKQLTYCTDETCLGQQKIDHGIEMKLEIKQYGRH